MDLSRGLGDVYKRQVLGKRELNPNFVGGKNDMSERRGGEERRPGGDRRDDRRPGGGRDNNRGGARPERRG
jgi:small subunit ribosomal protein S3